MEFSFKFVNKENLDLYEDLFEKTFPKAHHLNKEYLQWLYFDNPDGSVIGFDAFSDNRLAAHYACIPVLAQINGKTKRGLLSLNTATDPRFQGKGLFTRLAKLTYKYASENGFDFVYGVANQNSTPGFINKLGFSLICSLDAYFVVGKVSFLEEDWSFARHWNETNIKWRLSPPHTSYNFCKGRDLALADTKKMGIKGISFISSCTKYLFFPKLFIGRGNLKLFGFKVPIPGFLKPSPLNFIYKSLKESEELNLKSKKILIQFIDFDAY